MLEFVLTPKRWAFIVEQSQKVGFLGEYEDPTCCKVSATRWIPCQRYVLEHGMHCLGVIHLGLEQMQVQKFFEGAKYAAKKYAEASGYLSMLSRYLDVSLFHMWIDYGAVFSYSYGTKQNYSATIIDEFKWKDKLVPNLEVLADGSQCTNLLAWNSMITTVGEGDNMRAFATVASGYTFEIHGFNDSTKQCIELERKTLFTSLKSMATQYFSP